MSHAVDYLDGTKTYFKDNKLHRIDGPAFIDSDGTEKWFFHGKLHRTDGLAIVYPDGKEEWCVYDERIEKQY